MEGFAIAALAIVVAAPSLCAGVRLVRRHARVDLSRLAPRLYLALTFPNRAQKSLDSPSAGGASRGVPGASAF
jgi:hypothetical protein